MEGVLDTLNFFFSDFKSSWNETKRENKSEMQHNPSEKDKALFFRNLF